MREDVQNRWSEELDFCCSCVDLFCIPESVGLQQGFPAFLYVIN